MRSPFGLLIPLLPCFVAAHLVAQSPDTTSFVTMQGKDTVAVEQFVRAGNTITGVWLQNQGGIYWHDYTLVLGPDGWPARYLMTLYTTRPHTFLLSVHYGADSATRIVVRDARATTERVAAQKGFPVGALSILPLDLALTRARKTHDDSTTILLDRAEVPGPSQPVPVKFFSGDSARIGQGIVARIDRNGRLLALRQGPRETRRAASLDLMRLEREFTKADSTARASRVAIALSPAALDRFVGEYSLNPSATVTIARAANRLTMSVGSQPPIELVPSSPTTFFLEASTAPTIEFETDASGNVVAFAIIQNGNRQRAPKIK